MLSKWLLAPVAVIAGAWAYGFAKTSRENKPIDPSFRQFAVGDVIKIDSDKMGFNPPRDVFVMQITSIDSAGNIRAKSIDPKLPNTPLGIGPNPIPIIRTAIIG